MSATPQPKNRAPRRLLAAAAGLATVGALVAAMPAGAHDRGHGHGHGHPSPRTVDVQLLSFNDLHGNLEPPAGSAGTVSETQADGTVTSVPAGGVEYLATSLRTARKGHPYSVTAAGGDMVGASPLLSGLFHDEPTIEALNGLKLDVTSVGNHEFDEGATELARLQNGGCHPVEGCYEKGKKFKGADFPYLAANVTSEKTGKPILKPYTVWKKNGVKIGFIGVTLEGTPDIVTANGVKGLKFHDEIETVNKYAKELDRQGVKSIVALIHEGGAPASTSYNYDCDSPGAGDGISGPIVDIAKGISPKVDALVTGHTHQAYVCTVPDPSGKPRMVTSASSFGKLYTDTTLTYDLRTKDIVRTSVRSANHVVSREQAKAADMTKLIDRWNRLAAPIANKPQGWITADIDGRGSTAPEKPLGNLIADAQLEGLAPADKGGAVVAFMNPGGIRADLVYAASGSEGDGVVTYGEAFTVQPFTNMMNVVDLTGAQLVAALQQQVSGSNEASPKILQVSKGLTYTLDLTKSGADRVVADTVRLNGAAIDPAKTYRVAMNEFLAGGGDGFAALGEGTNKLVGPSDLDLFNTYLADHSTAAAPLAPPATDRITIVR
ncbi:MULTISPECIES: bifunctional metallophosphatase/5'-nucleotidase [unclassified Streptomyces]|uniref:bifunctional metallophosphatase/5'-nucleotidase n=1 Tax=unclassified Streptomyces TaxID=2593676 RepID=UPI0001C1BA72|nr:MULTISPECIES: bifunctional metallophosphatase/5'-nucleotidase [unclassified Streptomyces]AEN11441.1 5'-Nucleotidase domain protein [Streptomyces sp. SirexAA-E]MYR68508.1 bifunctional metallophosphatase/5'-nucleotidase [Streptomyces sp. SID4939]MYS03275.1 bifunctional metallophosphatase/5'-nucleotidase [Streptomyces sp. SID4940]MYT62034.1 bifunctional metallophosphatase/5'-nucleotidase [Streptomyces sp. SID8357]MYT85404.1 bifunctional metallophosphatase/5'-nucleotidase [Streptomyces sp. SID8